MSEGTVSSKLSVTCAVCTDVKSPRWASAAVFSPKRIVESPLAEGLDDEVLCWTVFGSQRNQIVEVAESHPRGLLAAETSREIASVCMAQVV